MQFIVIQRKDKGLAGFPLSTSAIIYSLQPWCFLSTAFYSQTLDPGWRNSRPTPLLSSRNRCNKHSIYSRPTVTSCQEAPGDYLCTATTLECGIVELRSSAVLLSYVASKRFRRSVINVCRCTLETCNRYNDQWEKVNTDTKAAFFVLQAKKLYTFMLITNRG